MQINASPRIFSDKEYLSASFFLQVPAKKMKSINFIPVSPFEYGQLDMPEYRNNDYGIKLKYGNNIIYYVGTPKETRLLCIGYILTYFDVFQVNGMLMSLMDWEERNSNIDCYIKDYEDAVKSRIKDYLKASYSFRPVEVSLKFINRIMAKHRGSAKIEANKLILTFNKVKCGNETEGHINYKFIEVHLNLEKLGVKGQDPLNIVYGFQKFSIDAQNGISGVYTLHPHIRQSHICFGSRQDDWGIYTQIMNFPFMIDVLYENLNNYEPSDAYMSVTEIVKTIKTLNIVFKDYKKMNPASDPEGVANHIFTGINKCSICYNILDTNGECFTNRCKANKNAIIKCDKCGRDMERGKFSQKLQEYEWFCTNTDCIESPKWNNPLREELNCKYCGHPLHAGSLEEFDEDWDGIEIPDYDEHRYRPLWCNNREHSHIRGEYQRLLRYDSKEVVDVTSGYRFQRNLANEELNILNNKTEEHNNETRLSETDELL